MKDRILTCSAQDMSANPTLRDTTLTPASRYLSSCGRKLVSVLKGRQPWLSQTTDERSNACVRGLMFWDIYVSLTAGFCRRWPLLPRPPGHESRSGFPATSATLPTNSQGTRPAMHNARTPLQPTAE